MTKHTVKIVRANDDSSPQHDNYRVLVYQLVPRGQTKAAVDYDEWTRDAAPMTELRRWYGHETERLSEFARRYRAELSLEPATEVLRKLPNVRHVQQLILLTTTRDVHYSGATVLRNVIVRASDS